MSNPFGDLLGSMGGPSHDERLRILKIEQRIAALENGHKAHRNALDKINGLLKTLIDSVKKLGG